MVILKKVNDYGDARFKEATKNIEEPNKEEADKAHKAKSFRTELIAKALPEYPHIESFLKNFEELLLSIEISSFNGSVRSVQNLYFPKHPIFDYLAADTRDRVML